MYVGVCCECCKDLVDEMWCFGVSEVWILFDCVVLGFFGDVEVIEDGF